MRRVTRHQPPPTGHDLRSIRRKRREIARKELAQTYQSDKDLLQRKRRHLDWISNRLGIQTQEDWYRVHTRDIIAVASHSFLREFNSSIHFALQVLYPEFQWDPMYFSSAPKGIWTTVTNQRAYFDRLAEQLNIQTFEDWMTVKGEDIVEKGGSSILVSYGGSLVEALKTIYPEIEWNPHLFLFMPKSHWADTNNHKKFFDWVAAQKNIQCSEDWMRVTEDDVRELGGAALLKHYSYSLENALQAVYPEQDWSIFTQKERTSFLTTRRRMDWLAARVGIQNQEDWYNWTATHLRSVGGAALLREYSDSLPNAVQKIYPEFDWHVWRFKQVPHFYWRNAENQRKCMDWVAERLGITSHTDWSKITKDQIKSVGVLGLFSHYGSLSSVLERVYPEINWDCLKLGSEGQTHTWKVLRRVVGRDDIHFNYRLGFPNTTHKVELDIYIPSKSLAIEYQGGQHYSHNILNSRAQQKRDEEKRRICRIHGITLLEVPYWWNNDPESLITSIAKVRPDIKLKQRLRPKRVISYTESTSEQIL